MLLSNIMHFLYVSKVCCDEKTTHDNSYWLQVIVTTCFCWGFGPILWNFVCHVMCCLILLCCNKQQFQLSHMQGSYTASSTCWKVIDYPWRIFENHLDLCTIQWIQLYLLLLFMALEIPDQEELKYYFCFGSDTHQCGK